MGISPWRLGEVVRRLRAGGIIAYPTEAVFGLGCDPENEWAVRRLLALKRRPLHKGLILIAADLAQLARYIGVLPEERLESVLRSWPGPSTWLLPAAAQTPDWLTGGRDSLAVRITAHRPTRALCLAWGSALVSTSANPTGRPPARSTLQVRRYFGKDLDAVLSGPLGNQTRPTPIRDARTGALIRA
jgi:L-threonylcarbamoyladenylate synthase